MTIGPPRALTGPFLVLGAALLWAPSVVLAQISERPSEAQDTTATAEVGQAPAMVGALGGTSEPYSHDRMAPRAQAVRTAATFARSFPTRANR